MVIDRKHRYAERNAGIQILACPAAFIDYCCRTLE